MNEPSGIRIAMACVVVMSILMFGQCVLEAQTPKVNQLQLREQIKSLKEEQRQEVNRIEDDLKKSKAYATELWTALEKAQEQVQKIGTERDGWRDYGNDQHDKLMNAEVRVAKKQATILKLWIALGGMTVAIAAYILLRMNGVPI